LTSISRRHHGFVFLVAAVCTALFAIRTQPLGIFESLASLPIDFHKYVHMVRAPLGSFHVAPFCWRIGAPLLAKLLPFDPLQSLLMLAVISVLATGMLVYATACRLGFSHATSIIGMLLYFSIGFAAKMAIHTCASPQALLDLTTMAALFVGATGHVAALAVVLALGVMVKESAILIVLLIYSIRARATVDVSAIVKYTLVCIPALLVLILIRILIPAFNDDPAYLATLPTALTHVQRGSAEYAPFELARTIGYERLTSFSVSALRSYTIEPFGLLALCLIAVRIDRSVRWLPRLMPYALAITAQMFVATDAERVLALAFPAVILLGLRSIDAIIEQSRLSAWDFAPLPLAMIALHAWTGRSMYVSVFTQVMVVVCGAIFLLARNAWLAHADRS